MPPADVFLLYHPHLLGRVVMLCCAQERRRGAVEARALRRGLAQLAQLGGGFANFAGNAPSQLNGLAAISGRFARVVATKAIPFCSWI
jgi:hypothetical protein